MAPVTYREAMAADTPAMAALRDRSGWAGGAPEATMRRYFARKHHPRGALAPRAAWLAEMAGVPSAALVGYAAAHLTTRLGCAGELQWLLVAPEARGSPVAGALLACAARWLVARGAGRVCVNVEPENARARCFYAKRGAEVLDTHWMVWSDVATALDARLSPEAPAV